MSALEDRRAALATETATLEKNGATLKAELQSLSEQQNRATEIVERWTSVAAALGTGAETFAVTRTSIPALERGRDPTLQTLRLGEFEGAVAACPLLTDAGKEMLMRLAALMLAGEVPLLHGPECDDFIEIAQSLISGGRNARLEADPTMISFDDLWIRPGTNVATPLRQAIAEASGESPSTQLCVISKADRSGARFWYPALADKAHRTELPPRFLVCATLKDAESDEAAEFASTGILLEAKDLIAPKASTVAPAILTGPNAKVFELHVETRQTDLTPGRAVACLDRLSLGNTGVAAGRANFHRCGSADETRASGGACAKRRVAAGRGEPCPAEPARTTWSPWEEHLVLDPIGGFERIKDFFVSYVETAFRISDERTARSRRELLFSPNVLATEPFIEPVLRYAASDRPLENLVDDERVLGPISRAGREAFVELALSGLFDGEDAPGPGPRRRSLYNPYVHQEKMLERGVRPGHPGIVTSGTGSGKTESFMLPLFARIANEAVRWPAPRPGYLENSWWRNSNTRYEPRRNLEHPDRTAAMRAIIIYPMNALVDDQMARLRKALDSDAARRVMDSRILGKPRVLRPIQQRHSGDRTPAPPAPIQ